VTEGEPAPPEAPPGTAPRKTPAGIKLLVGCLILLAVGFAGIALTVGVGGFALMRKVEAVAGGAEEQEQASALLDRVERDYPFTPPKGGVTPVLRSRFTAVTLLAWEDLRAWAEQARRLEARTADRPERRPNLDDALTVMRTAGGLVRSRAVLARSLAAERVSLSEYLWTGTALRRTGEMETARMHGVDAELVLALAAVWARAEGVSAPEGSRVP
jgi:hypothetical protein